MDEVETTLDEAWEQLKDLVGPAVLVTLGERPTTVEAYAKDGVTSLGFGYGKTPVLALLNLKDHIMRSREAMNG